MHKECYDINYQEALGELSDIKKNHKKSINAMKMIDYGIIG